MAILTGPITLETGDLTQFSSTVSGTNYALAADASAAKNGAYGLRATATSTSDTGNAANGYKTFTTSGTNLTVADAWFRFSNWTNGGYNTSGSKSLMELRDTGSGFVAWLAVRGTRQVELCYRDPSFAVIASGITFTLASNTWYLIRIVFDKTAGSLVLKTSTDGTNFTTAGTVSSGVRQDNVNEIGVGVCHISQWEQANYTVDVDDITVYDAEPVAATRPPAPIVVDASQIRVASVNALIVRPPKRYTTRGRWQYIIPQPPLILPAQAWPQIFGRANRPALRRFQRGIIQPDTPRIAPIITDDIIVVVPRGTVQAITRAGFAPLIADTPLMPLVDAPAQIIRVLRGTWRPPATLVSDAWPAMAYAPDAILTGHPRTPLRVLPPLIVGAPVIVSPASDAILIAVPRYLAPVIAPVRVPAVIVADTPLDALSVAAAASLMVYLVYVPHGSFVRFYGGLRARGVVLHAEDATMAARNVVLRARNTGE